MGYIMGKLILWVEQDKQMKSYIEFLELNDYRVVQEGSLTRAEAFLKNGKFDCVIVDMMLSTTPDEERYRYRHELTEGGLQTGLVFIERILRFLDTNKTTIMVLTQRLDNNIRNKCESMGIAGRAFVIKSDVEEAGQLLNRINLLVENS